MKKLKHLHRIWLPKTVATSQWLEREGYSRQLRRSYEKSDWIRSIGHGAYVWSDDEVGWRGGLYALQKQLGKQIHVGGKTALELQGRAHFVKFHETNILLFAKPSVVLPKWFLQHPWSVKVRVMRTSFLPDDVGVTEQKMGDFKIFRSSPERALMEALFMVPQYERFDDVYYLMESAGTLRPDVVQELLNASTNIKVNRLFLCLSEHLNHPWLKYIDTSKVDLGSGNRVVAKQYSCFDKKYKITLDRICITHEGYLL